MTTQKHLPVRDVPELALFQPPSVRLAPNIRVPFPSEIAALVDHPLFQRLRGVRQLGFVDRIYPSATHSRFEHSLGVFYKTIQFVHALWGDPNEDYFRDTMEPREIRALLVAALCHDLGQYPFSHVLEDTDRGADGELDGESVYDHEYYTRRILSDRGFRGRLLAGCGVEPPDLDAVLERLGVNANDVLAVLTGKDIGEIQPGTAAPLHSVIDGPIDADKLDYLVRDSHHAGVDFGSSIDQHRFFQALTVIEEPPISTPLDAKTMDSALRASRGEEPRPRVIAITEKGLVPAEEILIARWHMFTEVYWHRTTRAHEAVLAAAVRRLRALNREWFDGWFQEIVLDPRTTDDRFLELLLAIASGEPVPGRSGQREAVAGEGLDCCRRMLSSLACSSGRNPYKRLLSVSAENDLLLYGLLQELRGLDRAADKPVIDEMMQAVARQIHTAFSVRVDPFELVLDIPPVRSPANSVWVLSLDSPRRGAVARLASRSAMWRQFGDSFHDRTRKVRLFCPAETRQAIRESAGLRDSEAKLYEILAQEVHIATHVAVQLNFFRPNTQ